MSASLNDHPTLRDTLGRSDLLYEVAREITEEKCPMVLGVFGDWGSGKTSFLRQLQFLLTYDAPLDQVAEAVRDSKRRRPSETRARASQATDGKAHGTAFVPRRLV